VAADDRSPGHEADPGKLPRQGGEPLLVVRQVLGHGFLLAEASQESSLKSTT
jgi:hypothetical protein